MKHTVERKKIFEALAELYSEMEEAYNLTAQHIGLSCEGCIDNCCRTFFQHHTYIEWAYLWKGLEQFKEKARTALVIRAQEYVAQSRDLLEQGKQPHIMCPLNENGLCQLYEHRLMICRMHGVPNSFVRPDGNKLTFPGCIRSQALYATLEEAPILDRTPHYRKLASLEMTLRGSNPQRLARVNLTIAEMLVQGPPKL